MPTDESICGVAYRQHENGGFEVGGAFPSWSPDSPQAAKIVKFWTDFGSIMTDVADKYGYPVAWVVAFMAIESGGDPNACAPCVKELNGKQFCSFAPNCGGPCCAYGLLQVINSNVVKLTNGQYRGEDLLGNPALAIDIGMQVFDGNMKRQGNVLAAVKCYNGCGGGICTGGGMFGAGGQGNYVENFARATNTFLALGLAPASRASTGANTAVLFAMGIVGGYLAYEYLGLKQWIRKVA